MAQLGRWKKAAIGGATFLAVGIGGLVVAEGLNGPEAERDDATQEVTAAGNVDALALQLGDCFEDLTAGEGEEFSRLPIVPCADPHNNEVFYTFTMTAGDYPDTATFDSESYAACDPAFEAFIGLPYADSTLEWFTIQPTEQGWTQEDDREVLCVVADPAGAVEGSLEDAAR